MLDGKVGFKMAEIKSTLDLVMERTRHLKLNDQERRQQQEDEFKGRLAGIYQKIEDGLLLVDEGIQAISALKAAFTAVDSDRFSHQVLASLSLERNNADLMAVIATVLGVDLAPVKQLLENYRQAQDQARVLRSERNRSEITTRFGISGSAVVPNLDADELWHNERQQIASRFAQRLEDCKATLIHHAEHH
jgi:hypothetical protein